MTTQANTKRQILRSAREALLEYGYSQLSTRRIAEEAGVPLSQIHYHFGSKQGLVLEILAEENRRLVERQKVMFEEEMPLWKQWEQACDYLEDDLESGYVRVLQEMTAAGWTDPKIAAAVREMLAQWLGVLGDVAQRASQRLGGLGPFTSEETAVLAAAPFLGVEALILLGFKESEVPARSALRKVGQLIRRMEEAQ